jgi:hypothetical protein
MSSARQTTDHGERRRWIEERDLAFLHQDRTGDGKRSRFSKFASRS